MTTAVRTPGGLRGRGGLRMTPGRWAVLAIGLPVLLVIIGWSGFSIVAAVGRASFPVSFPLLARNHQVAVSTGGGDVTVRQAPAGQGHLGGTVQYSLFRPHVSHTVTAGGTSVSVDCNAVVTNCGLNATVDVPTGTAVRLNSGGGNMDVSGIGSDVTLTSGGGDVSGTSLSAPAVTMDTGGGNVTLVFTTPPASLNITSSGGDVSVLLPRGSTRYDISSTTSGGDYGATVPTGSSPAHKITVNSGGGNVSIAEAS